MAAPGLEKIEALRSGGASEEDIQNWKADTAKTLMDGGATMPQVDDYFGHIEPDMAPAKKMFSENKTNPNGIVQTASAGPLPPGHKEADDVIEAFEAGWQTSVSGLVSRGKMPTTITPDQAPFYLKVAAQIGQIGGDIPAMIAGGIAGAPVGGAAGGAVGTAIFPGLGTVAGAAVGAQAGMSAGAFAAPAMMRKMLIDHYEKGDILDPGDFLARTGAVMLEGLKGSVTGLATSAAGPLGSALVSKTAAPFIAKSAATAAEITAMTTVGAAVEGHLPKAEDFVMGAILVGGGHSVISMGTRFRSIYKDTGIKPEQVLAEAKQNPVTMTELVSDRANFEPPRAFQNFVELPKGEAPLKLIRNDLKTKNEFGVKDEFVLRPIEKVEPVKVETEVVAEAVAKPVEAELTANEKISSRIVSTPERPGEKYDAKRLYEDTIDHLSPLKDMEKAFLGEWGAKNLPIEQSAYGMARTFKGIEGTVNAWFEFGPVDFHTGQKTGTRGLAKILNEMGPENRKATREYAVAKRALEKAEQGVETGIDLVAAKEVVRTSSPEVKAYSKEILKFRNEVFQYLVDGGIIAKDAAARMQNLNEHYTPFHRLGEDRAAKGSGKSLSRSTNNPVKEMKGSEDLILDPLESIVKDTGMMVAVAEKNKILRQVSEIAKSNPELAKELGFEKKDTSMKEIKVSEKEVQRSTGDVEAEAISIFRPEKTPLAENEISFLVEGKRETWTVPKDVKRALDGMDGSTSNIFLKMMGGFSRSLRMGVTASPEFMLKNPFRDNISAYVVSKNGYNPWDFVRGMKEILKEGDHFQKWMYEGGANASAASFDMKSLGMDLAKLDKQTGIISKTWNVAMTPFHKAHMLGMLLENSTRVGEYMKGVQKGKSSKQAAFEARDLIDFSKVGAKGRAVNQIISFWNVNLQGKARLAEAFRDDPMGAAARLTASTVIPTMLLWWAQKDDPRIKEQPDWIKDNFFVVGTDKWEDIDVNNPPPEGAYTREVNGKTQVNNGIVFRLPMAQDISVVGALVRRTLDQYVGDNPSAYDGFSKVLGNLIPNDYIPNAFAPVIENITNHSMFTDRPLVPHGLLKELPADRFTENTTELAKKLSSTISNIPGMRENAPAPIVVENYIRQWTGTLGMYSVQLLDYAGRKSGALADPVKAEATYSDIPFVKAFVVRYPTAGAQSIEDFRKRYQSASLYAESLKSKAEAGDFVGYEDLYKVAEAEHKLSPMKGIYDALSNSAQVIKKINASEMTANEKRQFIDQVLYQQMVMTQNANKILDEVEEIIPAQTRK